MHTPQSHETFIKSHINKYLIHQQCTELRQEGHQKVSQTSAVSKSRLLYWLE